MTKSKEPSKAERDPRSLDRLSKSKERLGVVISRKLADRVRKVAKAKGQSVSMYISIALQESLDESEHMAKFFSDPNVRSLFVDMIKKPGAMHKLLQAVGAAGEPPEHLQTTIFDAMFQQAEKEPLKR